MIDTEALRKKIINLAIQGKLSQQLPEDGNAEDLYTQIQQEQTKLIKEGKIKKEKPLPEISDDEIPFEIPENWKWCRLANISSTNIGLTYHPEDIVSDGTIVIRSSNIINSKMDYTDLVKVNCSIRENQYLNNNDIVICARNGSKALVGKCAIFEGDSGAVSFGAFMAVLRTPCYKYIFIYLHTDAFRRYFHSDDSKQINQVTQNVLKEAVIPLPPFEEQKRIIKIIDEIFAQIDIIDTLQHQYESDREILKGKIIDAGIRGKLTEQLPEDGNAEDLYVQIQEEKAKLIKEGTIKKEKLLPEISEDEIPFDIPENWKWVRINDIGSWSAGATPSRGNKKYYEKGTIPWIKTGELNDGIIDDAEEYITDLALKECSVRLNPVGSVLIAMYGATIGKVGILNIDATTNQACCACILISINNRYLFYFLKFNKAKFLEASHGGAQPNISKEIITNGLMPLPPLEEQRRIVQVLDEVLSFLS